MRCNSQYRPMSSIFPLRENVSLGSDRGPRLVGLDEETADEVFEALAAQTTREIFLALQQEPATASDLAEATETTVQNVQYHLQKLREADLITVVDTWYSARGTEMNVYAPKDESLVLFAGRNGDQSIRQLLKRVLGGLGVLVPASALVGALTSWQLSEPGTDETDVAPAVDEDDAPTDDSETRTTDDDEDVVAEDSPEEAEDDFTTAVENETVTADNDTAGAENGTVENATTATNGEEITELLFSNASETTETAAAVDPLLAAGLFFLGGLVVLATVLFWEL